jgi:hypothetical protein
VTRSAAAALLLVALGGARAHADDDEPMPASWHHIPTHGLFSIEAGPIYRFTYDESFFSGGLSLVMGAQDAHWGGGIRLEGQYGATRYGLPFTSVSVGPAFEFKLTPRLRLGFGVPISMLFVERVTEQNQWLVGVSAGAWAQTIVDLAHSRRHGDLFLDVRAGFDIYWADASPAFWTQIAIGYRFPTN